MKTPKTYLVDEYGRHYELIKGYIPENYSIWNANTLNINNKYYLKLYNNNEVKDYTVNINSLKCIEVTEEEAKTIDRYCSTPCRNYKELLKALNSKEKYWRDRAEIMKPYIIKLFNIKFTAPVLHTKAEIARSGLDFRNFKYVKTICNNGEYTEIIIQVFNENYFSKIKEVCKNLNNDFVNSKVFVEPAICY